ncbi:hypothetical protein QAD02_013204 [Eretmocerus hayati]|uniref:Uncharacterized protein n=1 Tax=Eretmocerus hayati TaxID=131215 RepID=A0ACC2P208_9HYME|nr:hypothetical protein QAD02_013204 [Eretmocerus hayati]
MDMASQSGLPPKVIKHWFRNTLFKERQRNKDSPYNFNNPPCTTLNLEEYEKTGEAKVISLTPEHSNKTSADSKSPDRSTKNDRDYQDRDRPSITHQNRTETPISIPLQDSNSSSPMLPPRNTSQSSNNSVSSISFTSDTRTVSPPLSVGNSTNSPTRGSELIHNGMSAVASNGNINSGKRANRTRFTDYQIKVLQEFFENNAYPKDDDLEYLSKLLSLSPRVIVVWFQNARQKARKVYENQPPTETACVGGKDTEENTGRFQRTPSLNYQCKKCLLVFQRYYELIRHQKTHCFKEEDAKRSAQAQAAAAQVAAVLSSEDSNSSSNTTINTILMNSSTIQIISDQPPISSATNSSNQMNPTVCSTDRIRSPESREESFRCDKCEEVFGRFDSWREHQLTHLVDQNLFCSRYPPDSAYGILQQQALNSRNSSFHDPHPLPNPNGENKRKLDVYENSHDPSTKLSTDNIEQPRDKRLRTTILPEQLDFLYQKYQNESNPSRKMLETIAREVGLKKRVVQVWFQNTRARERKGQFRAHNQVINKRCPFCPALFKVKSALESHLNSKHVDQMTRKGIIVDNIPDEELSLDSSHSNSSAPSAVSSIFPPNPADVGASYKKYYEESMKRYMSEMRLHTVDEGHDSKIDSIHGNHHESPLDLSRPVSLMKSVRESGVHSSGSVDDQNQQSRNTSETRIITESTSEKNVYDDDSMSETTEFLDDESSPTSPASSSQGSSKFGMNNFMLTSNAIFSNANSSQSCGGKRYRTQMSTTQVKVMKSLFSDYKTPTMAECEMLGQEIGLPKRVVQVRFLHIS